MDLRSLRSGALELRLKILSTNERVVKLEFSAIHYPLCETPQIKRTGQITVLADSPNSEVCAELVAANWLLGKEKVFDDKMDGENLQILVSHKETYLSGIGQIDKHHPAQRYTQAFKTRYAGCEWLLDTVENPIEKGRRPIRVGINAEHEDLFNAVTCPNVELPIVISEHAQQQFSVRNDGGVPKRPWQSMARMLSKRVMKVIELPEKVKAHQNKKHNEETVVLNNGKAMHFVGTPVFRNGKPKYLMIVTVYLMTPHRSNEIRERIEKYGSANHKAWGVDRT